MAVSLFESWRRSRKGRIGRPRNHDFRPGLEALEDRLAPTVSRLVPLMPITFMVTNTRDAGPGSLRQAILDANAHGGADKIRFAIPSAVASAAPQIIQPRGSGLPAITGPVDLDATSQPGFHGSPIVVLDGILATLTPAGARGVDGLRISAPSCTVRGLAIGRFSGDGIHVTGNSRTNGGNVIVGNYIGTDATGTLARPNHWWGVNLETNRNRVGGTTAADRNVISGNSGSGVRLAGYQDTLQGNYIGTDPTGSVAVANGTGVFVDHEWPCVIDHNVISGNSADGIDFLGVHPLEHSDTHDVVYANKIGTDATGTRALGNYNGILLNDTSWVLIGLGSDGNVIAGNRGSGVVLMGRATAHNGMTGNLIGMFANGAAGGNGGHGVYVTQLAHDNWLGSATPGNVIANNGGSGVYVESGMGNKIMNNAVYANGRLGIDLGPPGPTANDYHDTDTGANGLQNAPELGAISYNNGTIDWSLHTRPGSPMQLPGSYVIQLFRNSTSGAHGQVLIGTVNVTVDRFGDAHGTLTLGSGMLPAGEWITATATSADEGTSEFSDARQVDRYS